MHVKNCKFATCPVCAAHRIYRQIWQNKKRSPRNKKYDIVFLTYIPPKDSNNFVSRKVGLNVADDGGAEKNTASSKI